MAGIDESSAGIDGSNGMNALCVSLDNDHELAVVALDTSERPSYAHKFEGDDRQQHETPGNQGCQ
jgi:hypothetical protein